MPLLEREFAFMKMIFLNQFAVNKNFVRTSLQMFEISNAGAPARWIIFSKALHHKFLVICK